MVSYVSPLYGSTAHRQRLYFPIPLQQVGASLCPDNIKLKVCITCSVAFSSHCSVTKTHVIFHTELFL